MKSNILKAATWLAGATFIAGCGGGSSSGANDEVAAPKQLPTVHTVDGRLLNSCAYDPVCSNNPHAPFNVHAAQYNTTLPPDGAELQGYVRLQVSGIELENVELLPEKGYLPRRGIFHISRDKTNAWLDLDTRSLPNGPNKLRISGFNVPAGQPGAVEKIAMPARTWHISNPALANSRLTARVSRAPAAGARVSGKTRLEIRGSGIANAELLPAKGYSPRLGQFNVSADRTFAWLDLDTRSIPDGVQNLRISAYNVAEGQPNAREVIAMAPRQWQFRNGATQAFTSRVTSAPVHGATVRGVVVLEVRGDGMKNIELLPASGYVPPYGQFKTTFDGTFGYLNFDTRDLPNGPTDVRISAFNMPPGEKGAKEIISMPVRTWIVDN